MEIKTRLSMPRTISSRINVSSPIHAVGSFNQEKSHTIKAKISGVRGVLRPFPQGRRPDLKHFPAGTTRSRLLQSARLQAEIIQNPARFLSNIPGEYRKAFLAAARR